jgi:hypothetical protein
MKKRVPLIDRTGEEVREIGWAEVDEDTGAVGDMVITDEPAKLKFAAGASFSIADPE